MPSSTSATDQIFFEGTVTGVRFTNAETGFTIFEIEDKKIGKIILKGEAPPLSRGIKVAGEGVFIKDPKWGNQIDIKSIKKADPDSNDGIEAYLVEHVENIGPVMARRLVAAFGTKTLEVIRRQPERIREVPGIGAQRAESISNAANALIEAERVMVFLNGHGITGSVAMKLYREYGNKTLDTIKADPWVTADHIDGIGFLTADRMAASMGMTGAHPGRIRAGLVYTLKQAESEGHTGLTKDTLCIETAKLLQLAVADRAITRRVDELVHSKELMVGPVMFRDNGEEEEPFVQRGIVGRREAQLASRLIDLIDEADLPWEISKLRESIASRAKKLPYALSDDQVTAIDRLVRYPVNILTGGPGTGKTTLLGLFLMSLKALYPTMEVALCAPTGKAAERMKESVNDVYESFTTHRMLGSAPGGGFSYNKDNPLPFRLIVADESSMYDVALMYALCQAIDDGCALLIVGDTDQLPSIGAGAVLNDLIASGLFGVSRLTQIHRQAALSKIITNAHAINNGRPQDLQVGGDFSLIRRDTSEEVQEGCIGVYAKMIDKGIKPDDIMVLTSGHKAASGTMEVNEALRKRFNPNPAKTLKAGKTIFGVGDRIIVTRNNYKLDVRNGQMGMIKDINTDDSIVICEIEGRTVEFTKSFIGELRHGYCITIHKAQGSQAKYVIMLVDKAHYMLLERTLVYTGVTRGISHVVVVSRQDALEHAIRNKRSRERKTALYSHLRRRRHEPTLPAVAA